MPLWIAAQVVMRSTAEGGRRSPFVAGGIYRPAFRVAGSESATSLVVQTIDGSDEFEPGATGTVEGWLFMPEALNTPVVIGTQFLLAEGAREVGSGIVVKVGESVQ